MPRERLQKSIPGKPTVARVVLEHVAKLYPNGHCGICDVDLEVAGGELLVLVGPSGSGKTTLLRMIAGLEQVTRGTISLDGRPANGLAPKDRNIAMVFQSPALYPHMTVYRNLAFSLAMRGIPKPAIRDAVLQTATLLGIGPLLDWKPRQLSGGQSQRVALGRALVRRPNCFLLDEPLSSLDTRLRSELRMEIKRLFASLGVTASYVTHDQEEAMALGGRIVVLYEGRVQQVGSPLDVFQHPRNRFVAQFLGSPPMNFLEGEIVAAEGGLWFTSGPLRLAVPPGTAGSLADRQTNRAVLGIRPEAISPRPIVGQANNTLCGAVHLVEPLGDRTDLHVAADPYAHLVARVDSRDAPPRGATVQLHFDLERVHFFSAESGENLADPALIIAPATPAHGEP